MGGIEPSKDEPGLSPLGKLLSNCKKIQAPCIKWGKIGMSFMTMLPVTRTELEQADGELRLGSRKKYVGGKKWVTGEGF